MAAPLPEDWKRQTAIVLQKSDKQVLALLRQFQKDVNASLAAIANRGGVGSAIRREQLQLAKREIQRRMAELYRKLGNVTSALRLEAANRVLDQAQKLDAHLLQFVGGQPDGADLASAIAQAERDAAVGGLDRMFARVAGASYIPLSQRVYKSSVFISSQLNNKVNSALARGLSAREFAAEIKDFINPNTPGGVRYAAMRLARTEINNAAHATAIDAQRDKPWVTGMKWHLSGSHPRPDICDAYAKGGTEGDGIYEKTSVPAKPHPHCFCFVTPETPDDEEFLNHLVAGKYDSYINQYRGLQPGQVIRTSFGAPSAAAPTPKPAKVPTPRPKPAPQPKPAPRQVPEPKPGNVWANAPAFKPAPVHVTQVQRDVSAISKIPGAEGERVRKALEFQAKTAPRAMSTLESVDSMTAAERARVGFDAVGGYVKGQQRIVLGNEVFSSKEARVWAKEVKSGWSAKPGHDHDNISGLIAHEFGHHVATALDRLTPLQRKEFWDATAKSLGLRSPLVYDTKSLDRWVTKNADVIGRKVSQYGATESGELLAEVWLEYSTNPAARPWITEIGARLRAVSEGGALQETATFAERLAVAARGDEALYSAPKTMTKRPNGLPGEFPDTPEQVKALGSYTGGRYIEINNSLRIPERFKPLDLLPGDQTVPQIIRNIDAALQTSLLPRDVVTWRGAHFDTREFFGDRIKGNLAGFTWTDRGYGSTSVLESRARLFAPQQDGNATTRRQSVMMRILVPKGTPAIQLSSRDAEAELVLPRGMTLRVVRDYGYDERGVRRLDVEIVKR